MSKVLHIQTGSERGTFTRGDKHPTVDGRVFFSYKIRSEKLEEVWCSPEMLIRKRKKNCEHERKNPEARLRRCRKFQSENKDHCAKYQREYIAANREKINAQSADRHKRRIESGDIIYKLKGNLRSRTRIAFHSMSMSKPTPTTDLLGADWDSVKAHIESLFEEGMSWDNYGDWHIDHIVPLSCATTIDGLSKLCHHTNLQPLWASDNLSKGDRLQLCLN